MKWLTKIGQIILKATEIAAGLAPLFPAQTPQIAVGVNVLQQLETIILNIETAGQALNLTGDQKLAAAVPLFAQVFLDSAKLAGHDIANHQLFVQGVTKITSGYADVLNSRQV